MAGQPHDKTGKRCADCGKEFVKSSATFTLSSKETGLIIKRTVCKDCVHAFHSKGE